MIRLLTTSLLCLAGSWVQAQGMSTMAPSECTMPDVAAAWRTQTGTLASQADTVAANVTGVVGKPYRVSLQACSGKLCDTGTWAGLFPITVPQDGRYRVAVNDMSAWLDVYSATGKNEGLMCEHSGCAPIRKIVQFDLKAGPQWVQVVTRKPAELVFLVMPVKTADPMLNSKSH